MTENNHVLSSRLYLLKPKMFEKQIIKRPGNIVFKPVKPKITGHPSIHPLLFTYLYIEGNRAKMNTKTSLHQWYCSTPLGGTWSVPKSEWIYSVSSLFWVCPNGTSHAQKTTKVRHPGGILIKSLTPLTPGVSTLNSLQIMELLSLKVSMEEASFLFCFSFFLPHQTWAIPLFLQMKPWSFQQYFALIYCHLTPRCLNFSIWNRHTLNLLSAIQHFVWLGALILC